MDAARLAERLALIRACPAAEPGGRIKEADAALPILG
jgi:hypothetical protein